MERSPLQQQEPDPQLRGDGGPGIAPHASVELSVAACLHPQPSTMFSRSPSYVRTLHGHRTQVAWEEMLVITDWCLRTQRCAAQAMGKVMGTMVLQERARWLNLTSMSDREEEEDIVDAPIVPKGIFDSLLTSMRQRYMAKKKEDELFESFLI